MEPLKGVLNGCIVKLLSACKYSYRFPFIFPGTAILWIGSQHEDEFNSLELFEFEVNWQVSAKSD